MKYQAWVEIELNELIIQRSGFQPFSGTAQNLELSSPAERRIHTGMRLGVHESD